MISEYGLKIKNIKAATLYGCNLGVRERYSYTDAMFHNSLFSLYLEKNGLRTQKGGSTRDIICLEFDFGQRSFEEDLSHLQSLAAKAEEISDGESDNTSGSEAQERISRLIAKARDNKDKYVKKTKEEIREDFYENGVTVCYTNKDRQGAVKNTEQIEYRMLYRNASKAKTGQVMFINKKLYKKAYDWLTMGLGNKLPKSNAKIVELSAYAPLTTSTIVDTIHIPVEHILILKDQDSFFRTTANVVESAGCEGSKICIVNQEEVDVKNTIWDGMGLVEADLFPEWVNGMGLLRNHFFKMCGFKSRMQKYFRDWCGKSGKDYETYEVEDMFGVRHRLKDIKVITTDNAIKWKKFIDLMGGTGPSAYRYWCERVNRDGSLFGIVKTDHVSKLGELQQMSYQMINTLPCTRDDIFDIAKTSVDYVELLKNDNREFSRFLRKNANEINHYEMMADLYDHNPDFAGSKWFRTEKRKIISNYVYRLRKGKITVNADNLTICGNPYALLLYAVGEPYTDDPTLSREDGSIQCYTTRFADGEYLCAFRNPHNSPNNICCLHNRYSKEMEEYFPFSRNILAINCIGSDIQDRANGCDEDSDFFFVTNQPTMVRHAKACYRDYPTIVNRLCESGVTYKNAKSEYARMDNKFAKAQRYIGEASNLAQLAMTYYWTQPSKELYDNFVILSVLAQIAIDGCKREYDVDAPTEIDRIKKMNCMNPTVTQLVDGVEKLRKCDLPEFMQYTKDVPVTKNGIELPYEEVRAGRDRIKDRVNKELTCPMNWLQECLNQIQNSPRTRAADTKDFFIKMPGKPNNRQMTKIVALIDEYDSYVKNNRDDGSELYAADLISRFQAIVTEVSSMKIGNPVTINRLIETALSLDDRSGGGKKNDTSKYTRKLLNVLYRSNKEKFLANFTKKAENIC